MKKHLLLPALFALLGGALLGVSDAVAKIFPEPSRTCTQQEISLRQCRNQPVPGQTYMFGARDYCRQDNAQEAKTALSYIQYKKPYTELTDSKQRAEVDKLLGPTTKERSAVGLVPCGRSCDDPTTAVNEAADCAFCHFFVLLSNIINWIVWRIVPVFAVLMVVLGGFVLLTSRGSPGQSSKGKDILIWTFAGYAVVLLAWMAVNSFFTGIGVMKWTGLRGETGEFERYFARSTGHGLQDLERSGDKAWKRGDWDGSYIELSHASWTEPKVRRIKGSTEGAVYIDEPVFASDQDPANVKYKIGGWWQFHCGLDGSLGTRVVAGTFKTTKGADQASLLYVDKAGWVDGYYKGYSVHIKSGLSQGEERVIIENGGHFLRLDPPLSAKSEKGDEFEIFVKNSPLTSTPATPAPTPTLPTQFQVQPYIVYPADKLIVKEYETAVNQLTPEIRDWYKDKVGATFMVLGAKVEPSPLDYATLRCGTNPTPECLNDPSLVAPEPENEAFKAAKFLGTRQPGTIALIFGVGGGGIAGGDSAPNFGGYVLVGDWVLEPISKVRNDWGIPCSFAKKNECELNTAQGTVAHELGHAFGLSPFPGFHPPKGAASIMDSQEKYPIVGFLPEEKEVLLKSPFFK